MLSALRTVRSITLPGQRLLQTQARPATGEPLDLFLTLRMNTATVNLSGQVNALLLSRGLATRYFQPPWPIQLRSWRLPWRRKRISAWRTATDPSGGLVDCWKTSSFFACTASASHRSPTPVP